MSQCKYTRAKFSFWAQDSQKPFKIVLAFVRFDKEIEIENLYYQSLKFCFALYSEEERGKRETECSNSNSDSKQRCHLRNCSKVYY